MEHSVGRLLMVLQNTSLLFKLVEKAQQMEQGQVVVTRATKYTAKHDLILARCVVRFPDPRNDQWTDWKAIHASQFFKDNIPENLRGNGETTGARCRVKTLRLRKPQEWEQLIKQARQLEGAEM